MKNGLKEKGAEIYSRLIEHYGYVVPELHYTDIYQLTIAVILSAQTTDRQVNLVTPPLFEKYPDFQALANADIEDIEAVIHSTGFYRNKAKNIHKLAAALSTEYHGIVPSSIEELVQLPGIGRKSANVIVSQGFGKPGLAVDTHVARTSSRLGLTENKNPDLIEKDLKGLFPEETWGSVHLLLIKHGRTLCGSRKPNCPECPLADLCRFPEKNL